MMSDHEVWRMETLPPLPPRPVAPGWLITFADLLSLMLAFFVLMFAATSVSEGEWRRVVRPIASYFSGVSIAPLSPTVGGIPVAPSGGHDLAYVQALLDRALGQSRRLAGVSVNREDHRLVVTLPMGLGAADLTGGDPPVLGDLARVLGGLDNKVTVETRIVRDDRDGPGVHYWARAMDQSLAIAAELTRLGDNHPVACLGAVSREQSGQVRLVIDETGQSEAPHGPS